MKYFINWILFKIGIEHKCQYSPWEVAHAQFNLERFASDEITCEICSRKSTLLYEVDL